MAAGNDFPTSYRDPVYAQLDATNEQRLGLPAGMLQAVRTEGEKSNSDQMSSAGARTVYQITPATRKAILDKYGIDAYLSPQTASMGAGRLLKESLDRNGGDPESAVREYHGGTDRSAWGKQNDAYWQRVSSGMRDTAAKALMQRFGQWLQDNPADVPLQTATAAPSPAPADLASGFQAWLSGAGAIPGSPEAADRQPPALGVAPQAEPAEPGLADKAIGAGEAYLNALTGGGPGAVGYIGGTLKGLAESILSGQFGTQEAADMVERSAQEGARALTYQPRTQSGREQAQAVGEAMQQLTPAAMMLPALLPEGAAAATAAPAARAVKAVTTLPRRAIDAIKSSAPEASATPGTLGSAGAAATDMAAQRTATAESMPVPLKLTKGQATRDPAQLKFEVETAKMPEQGTPLRRRYVEQNDGILRNFDTWIDQTNAEAPNLRAVGQAVDKALVEQAARDKTEVNVAYARAKRSPEAQAPVDQSLPVAIGEGDNALTSTPLQFLNEQPSGLPSTGLADAARQYAQKLGIADLQDGQLVPRDGVSIRQMEDWRKAISQATGYEPADVRQATILKALIDGQTEPVAGPLFRQARAARARYAQNYEDRAVIAKLLDTKRGTSDRQVAFEDVFHHTILKGTLDDVRNVRRVLQRSGADGSQAWRELQGATIRWIRDEATKDIATDASGNRVVSPAALDKAIRALDHDGRLEFVFGKKGAQQLRDINDLAQYVKTVPPEAAVNTSNTVATLLAAFGDVAISGTTGTPAPVITAARLALRHIKDVKLRNRINDALNEAQRKQAPGQSKPAVQAPGAGETVH
jgi:hypothetical protein